TSGPVGTTVTITGNTFTGSTAVKFNGIDAASFTVVSDTSVTATVAAGTSSGTISVTTPSGIATSAGSFTVLPRITSFAPTSAPVGTVISISGNSFLGATAVKFNGL